MTTERVLVTGSEGFIGSHLVEALVTRGDDVRAFVQYNSDNRWGWLEDVQRQVGGAFEVFTGDLRDPFSVRQAVQGTDRVFHLGALIAIPYSYRAPHEYVATNVMGTLNVLQAALEHGVQQVIHTSTSEVYGTARYVPIDEAHPLQGQSPYSASKIGADKLAESYNLSFALPVTTIRPFNTFGPRQSARAVIPTIITQALAEEKISLGALTPVRDLTFVTDTVRGFVRAAEVPEAIGEVINLGQGSGITIGDLAREILSLMNSHQDIVEDRQRLRPERSEVLELVSDNSKARSLLGWSPQVSLRAGLETTIEWLRAYAAGYKAHIFNE